MVPASLTVGSVIRIQLHCYVIDSIYGYVIYKVITFVFGVLFFQIRVWDI